MNKSETIGKFAAAFVKAQASMENATKGSANPFFKSKFADLNAIREACTPPLNEQGISILQPTTVVEGKHYIETILLHESGEYLSGLYEIVVAKANDPQSLGAAISYARRYGLQSMVSVGAEDDDGESANGRKQSYTAQVKTNPTIVKTNAGSEAPKIAIGANTTNTLEVPKKGFGVKPKVEVKTESDGWS